LNLAGGFCRSLDGRSRQRERPVANRWLLKGCTVSDEDPWKNWYQSNDAPNADATRDVPYSSRMPSGSGRSSWPEQPPPSSGYGSGGGYGYGDSPTANAPAYGRPSYGDAPYGGATYGGGGGGRRWRFWGQPGRHGRRIALYFFIIVLVILIAIPSTYFWVNGKLNKSVALPATTNTSAGTNWLITGTDSRTGLSRTQQDALHLGSVGADASDSLMLLHMGTTGKPVLLSIPRDSFVTIPGHGQNKINAALAFGGPALLVQTVELATGLKIDHYMGIGFEGLANVVGSVGGVQMCVKTAVPADPTGDSGFKGLAAGCHNLSGTQAIAFVRDRHSFATSDLQRIQDQRAFLAALLSKATSPGVYLNPFVALPFASTAASAISVDKGASVYGLVQAAQALRAPASGTVPIANANFASSAGDAVLWDHTKATELFKDLQEGKAVPASLLNGTTVG
jgi:LCP family protein required for cell wall assembly